MTVRRADRDSDRGPSDPFRVLATLDRHGVDHVVIGGWAMIAHGSTRTTNDIDFVASPETENLQRLESALKDLNAELWGVDAHLLGIDLDAQAFASGANFTLTTDAGGVDYFNEVPGGVPYEQLRERALRTEVRGVPVTVAAVDDLVRMKRAAGRPRDIRDLALLTELQAGEGDT
ncbi:MAG: nucleotidyl transferase AbiEii/AbiGii toxin family protein [Thermoleophilaceae bacterium]